MRKGEDLTGKWFGDIEVLGLEEEMSKEKPGALVEMQMPQM